MSINKNIIYYYFMQTYYWFQNDYNTDLFSDKSVYKAINGVFSLVYYTELKQCHDGALRLL